MVETKTFFEGGRAALVVIDLQQGIARGTASPHSAETVITNASRLAGAFRTAALPVILVRVAFSSDRKDALEPLVDNPTAIAPPAPNFSEIVSELGPHDGDVIVTKRNWGAFHGTDLDLQLRRRLADRIVICGISTNIGVESTARDAFERNYKLLFVEDAMSSRDAAEHVHSCTRIFPRMGIVRLTADVLSALSSSG